MKELSIAEKQQLDKDLEWKLQRRAEEIEDVKRAREAVDKAARGYFQPFADYYNAARNYYFSKLETRHRRRGDFETMEVSAGVSENYELILTGVWGSRCLTVKRIPAGFEVTEGDCVTKKTLSTEDDLRACLMDELFDDHPAVRDLNEKLYDQKKLLEEARRKAGCE